MTTELSMSMFASRADYDAAVQAQAEQTTLPDGLQLAVMLIGIAHDHAIFDAQREQCATAETAIRAEHHQRVTMQHHAADLAQRVADLEAERANAAAHIASIARQLGDEPLQVDDIAVRVLWVAAERDRLAMQANVLTVERDALQALLTQRREIHAAQEAEWSDEFDTLRTLRSRAETERDELRARLAAAVGEQVQKGGA